MKKINIGELLRNCPQGMELDCTMFDNLYFECIRKHATYPIVCYTVDSEGDKNEITFDWYGKYALLDTAKCVIFPKGKTTWEGFVPPCQFKDGDIIFTHANCLKVGVGNTWISIFKERRNGGVATYVDYAEDGSDYYSDLDGDKALLCMESDILRQRFATEEEKSKLFQAIKENGYRWNTETKTLEKLVKLEFEIDDWVVFNNHPEKGSIYQVKDTHNYEYTLQHILGGSMPIPFSKVDMLKLWTIDDAKNGDVLVDKDNNIGIFQKFEGIYWYSYIYLGCDGELRGFSIGGSHKQTDVHPATKEQRDLLFQKIKEAGYKWNPETKTLEKLNIPKEEPIEDKGNISDGYHTFNELYEYRLLYNASMFNELAKQGLYDVHKSKKHSDGTIPFGDENWFIVQAELPTGQISNHYEMKDWDLFQVPVKEKANLYDGHTPQDVAKRLRMFLTSDKLIEPKFKVGDKVRRKNNHNLVFTITSIEEDSYGCGANLALWFDDQDDYELVPKKFDITTLKPFDNCKYSLDGGITWKYAQYWFIQEKYNTNDISIELWQG